MRCTVGVSEELVSHALCACVAVADGVADEVAVAVDEFRFHNDLYNRILQETLEHLEDENFVAENYFANHPDPDGWQA